MGVYAFTDANGVGHEWDQINVPADIADGDDNTQLTESQVDSFVANNGYSTGSHTTNTDYCSGGTCGEGITITSSTTKPSCNAESRGLLWIQGGLESQPYEILYLVALKHNIMFMSG